MVEDSEPVAPLSEVQLKVKQRSSGGSGTVGVSSQRNVASPPASTRKEESNMSGASENDAAGSGVKSAEFPESSPDGDARASLYGEPLPPSHAATDKGSSGRAPPSI